LKERERRAVGTGGPVSSDMSPHKGRGFFKDHTISNRDHRDRDRDPMHGDSLPIPVARSSPSNRPSPKGKTSTPRNSTVKSSRKDMHIREGVSSGRGIATEEEDSSQYIRESVGAGSRTNSRLRAAKSSSSDVNTPVALHSDIYLSPSATGTWIFDYIPSQTPYIP
jgi:hypothetical protein